MRFRKVACFLASIAILIVAGCGGSSGTNTTLTTPTITWATPTSIAYGTALGSTQLDATASVPGTFTYSPASGTVLTAGSQTLSVSFTPTDTTKYASASATVKLTVTPVMPVVSWATPAGITYGTALGAAQLDATANTPGTFAYSPAAGQIPVLGSQTLSVTFTPTDATDYTSATASVMLVVNKGTPTITWVTPAAVTYGTALSSTQLDATASVPGTFVYSPAAGTVPTAGSQPLSVTFTPTDTTDYNSATGGTSLTVKQATPVISWTAPAPVSIGTTLSSAQLDATANVPGSFAYTPASGTVLTTAGTTPLNVTFTPTDTTDYNSAQGSVTLTVNQATPVITWTAPAAVTQGATLGSTQLDATASVPGTFVYTPASGTVLNTVGTTPLSVTFTPTDATDYTTATDSVSLTVNSNQPVATVDFGAQKQLIRGFGGSTAWLGQMPTAVATALFDPTKGLNLNILRVRIDYSGSPNSAYSYATSQWATEVTNANEAFAANPNTIVFATPWTPPVSMKLGGGPDNQPYDTPCTAGAGVCGGYLDPSHYADYAAYLEDFVTYFDDNSNTSLYAISMQNEPDQNATYESCLWTAQQMDSWVANYASVITAADLPYRTKFMMPESNSFNPAMAATALSDSNAEGFISIIAGHIYQTLFGGSITAYPALPAGDTPKELWQTEFGPLTTYPGTSPTWAQALPFAETVHNSMVTGQYNAYVWWGIFGAPTNAGSYGLVDNSGKSTVFGNAIGQYSKYIQPGYYRYNATSKPSASVYVSAYAGTQQGQDQHYVIVAINAGTSAVSQPFTIANATVSSVTAYQTTSAGVQPAQTDVAVTSNSFTYTLPAQSITTFVQ